FRQRAIEIISQVQRAYWDLVFARRDQQIKRESVGLAQTQLEHNRRLVDAGALAPADVISARLEVERRTDEAEAAVEAIQRTENELKALISSPNNAEFWGSALVPAEDPQLDPGPALPIDDALRLAFRSRPEMEQFRLRGELNQIDVDYYRNQSRPQIDLFATYGTQGLAGRRRGGINPIFGGNALLYERVNRLSELAGLVPLPVPTPGTVPTFLIGGYGTSLATLFKNDFRTWRVGVSFDIPLRNRTAEGQLGRALTEGRQLDAQRQRIEQTIEVEVRNALQAVETAKRRIAAALKSRDDARLQYESEVRKFDAGQSTNFFVLDRQNALSSAQVRLLRAYTDYTKSVAELQRALSTTLSSQSIEVK
ncbi:MAG TPA: TolC family protein, partial [Blastocatellia bacterium]|nr:TolC family protein [Blastocatellia bacterium]